MLNQLWSLCVQGGLGSRHRWLLLRGYCSLHIAAVFMAVVGRLPGMGSALQPEEHQQLLSIIGLWQPPVVLGLLPLLGLLLLATLHAGVDSAVQQSIRERLCRWVRPCLPQAACLRCCRLAAAQAAAATSQHLAPPGWPAAPWVAWRAGTRPPWCTPAGLPSPTGHRSWPRW